MDSKLRHNYENVHNDLHVSISVQNEDII